MEEGAVIGVRDVIRYEMVRPSFVMHIYHIYTLKKGDLVSSGKAPAAPLQNSRFDGSFIAGIAELRYLYSMPVERIVKYFQGNGFDLDKQTAHGLLVKTAGLFDNLYEAMHQAVKEGKYLNCDETYHTVLIFSDSTESHNHCLSYSCVDFLFVYHIKITISLIKTKPQNLRCPNL